MKKMGKRTAAAVLAAVTAVSGLPLSAVAVSLPSGLPAEQELNISAALPVFRQDQATGEFRAVPAYEAAEEIPDLLEAAESLPERFDLREHGKVSPVRRQSGYGTCWAHSACASAESSILSAVPDADLSEFHTAYYSYEGSDQVNIGEKTFSQRMNYGGDAAIVANLWSQWIGPVSEAKLPYGYEDFFQTDGVFEMKYEADYHLKEAYIIEYNWEHTNTEEVNAQIKELLFEGMPVDIAYCSNASEYYNSAYRSTNSNKRPRFSNHSVAIVGWDDSFSKENFIIQPEHDGAWLVKNSWGANYGDHGYIWISYDDPSLSDCYAFVISDKDDYKYNNQHDSYVPVNSICAWDDESDDNGSYMANIFTTYTDQMIGAVTTYIEAPGTDYEITVYTDLQDKSDPTSGTPSEVTSGTCDRTGFFTLELDKEVPVEAGTDFGVVAKMTCPDYPYVIPVESCIIVKQDSGGVVDLSGYTNYDDIMSNTGSGESFVSTDGTEWIDIAQGGNTYTDEEEQLVLESLEMQLYDGIEPDDQEGLDAAATAMERYKELLASGDTAVVFGNISLKALGRDPGTVRFSHTAGQVPAGETVELSGGSDIYYSINGGEEQKYDSPIEITEKMTISATIDGKNFSERTFEPARASLMSLGYQTGDSTGIHIISHGERTGENEYRISLDNTTAGIRLFPETYSSVKMNGKEIPSFDLSEYIQTGYGVTTLTLELSQENCLDRTVTVHIERLPYSIDLDTETISFKGLDSLEAPDGIALSDGSDVGAYAGQILIGKIGEDTVEVAIPEHYQLPGLSENFRRETLDGIPEEALPLLEISVGGGEFVSAQPRLVTDTDNNGIRIIPGEKISLRTKAGNGFFAGSTVEYSISSAPAAPEKLPGYTYDEGSFVFSGGFQTALLPDDPAELSRIAEELCYPDEDSAAAALSVTTGFTDRETLAKLAAVSWSGIDPLTPGSTIAVRYPATDSSYPSKPALFRLNQPGDADGDDCIDSSDASSVLEHYAEISTGNVNGTIPEEMLPFVDMNQDRTIDSSDASMILLIYAELMTTDGDLS